MPESQPKDLLFCNLLCFVPNWFCCDLRAFVWRKIESKIVTVEKMTNMRYALMVKQVPFDCQF